jgi:hypothetical protein
MTLLMTREETLPHLPGLLVNPRDLTEEVDDESIIESIMDGDCHSAKEKFSPLP